MVGINMDIPGPPQPVTVEATGGQLKVVGGDPQKAGLQPGTYIDARTSQVSQAVQPAARVEAGDTPASIQLPEKVTILINNIPQDVHRFEQSGVGYYYDKEGGKHNVVISTGREVDDRTAGQLRSQKVEQNAQVANSSEGFFNEVAAIQAWLYKDRTKKARGGEDIYHYIERVFKVPQDRMAAFAARVKASVDAQPSGYRSKVKNERTVLAAQDLLQQSFGRDVFSAAKILSFWSGRADGREWPIPEIIRSTGKSDIEISTLLGKLNVQPGEKRQQALNRFFSTKQSLI
jgi:hypothetical protein